MHSNGTTRSIASHSLITTLQHKAAARQTIIIVCYITVEVILCYMIPSRWLNMMCNVLFCSWVTTSKQVEWYWCCLCDHCLSPVFKKEKDSSPLYQIMIQTKTTTHTHTHKTIVKTDLWLIHNTMPCPLPCSDHPALKATSERHGTARYVWIRATQHGRCTAWYAWIGATRYGRCTARYVWISATRHGRCTARYV